MLRSAPRVRILATSREPLRAEGEWPKANGHTAWLRCTRRSRWMSSLRLASRDASPMVPALSGGRAAPFHSRRTPVSTRFRVRCQAHPRRSHDGADRLGRTPREANSGLTCVISEQHASSGLLSQRSTSKFAAMPVAISGSVVKRRAKSPRPHRCSYRCLEANPRNYRLPQNCNRHTGGGENGAVAFA